MTTSSDYPFLSHDPKASNAAVSLAVGVAAGKEENDAPDATQRERSPEALSSEEAMMKISSNSISTEEELFELARHPDAEVRAALAESKRTVIRGNFELRRVLAERAISEAEERNYLWTPLLNTLANESVLDNMPGGKNLSSLVAGMHHIKSVPQLLRPVEEWVASASTESIIRLLQDFRGDTISSMVAAQARVWSTELLDVLLTEISPRGVAKMANNPFLGKAEGERLHEWMLESFLVRKTFSEHLVNASRTLGTRGLAAGKETLERAKEEMREARGESKEALEKEARPGQVALYLAERSELSEDELLTIFSPWFESDSPVFLYDAAVVALLKHPDAGRKVREMADSSPMEKNHVGVLLTKEPDAPEDLIELAYKWVKRLGHYLGDVGSHPKAPFWIIREILKNNRKSTLQDYISSSEHALSDAEVRKLLGKSRSLVVQYRILSHLIKQGLGDDEMAPRLLMSLLDKNTALAVSLLNEPGAAKLQLTQKEILVLLQHELTDVRSAAMRLLGRQRLEGVAGVVEFEAASRSLVADETSEEKADRKRSGRASRR